MRSIERPSIRTQFLIFTLFGEYILPRGGKIWTRSLLYLLDRLGVNERAARATLSRMSQKGWLTSSKHGRQSQYALTARGWTLLKSGAQRIFEPPRVEWDGLWHLITFTLPQNKRSLRHIMRRQLPWYGFGPLTASTWIAPHDRTAELKAMCDEIGIQEHVDFFSGMHMGIASDEELVRRCWDLPDLATHYQAFISGYQDAYKESLASGNGRSPLPPETCFVRRFWLMYDFQSFPRRDPNLPMRLLPPNWEGLAARRLFDEYHHLLEKPANAFVESTMNGEFGS